MVEILVLNSRQQLMTILGYITYLMCSMRSILSIIKSVNILTQHPKVIEKKQSRAAVLLSCRILPICNNIGSSSGRKYWVLIVANCSDYRSAIENSYIATSPTYRYSSAPCNFGNKSSMSMSMSVSMPKEDFFIIRLN